MTTSKYHPICKQPAFTPQAPSVTFGDSSLPEGAIFLRLLRFHIGFLKFEGACYESLSQKSEIFASSHRPGAFAGSARSQFRTKLVCNRYFPDPPGIVTEKNGERKHRHCARIAGGGTPPRPVSAGGVGSIRLGADLVLSAVFHVAGLDDRGLGVVGLSGPGVFLGFFFHIHPSKASIPRNKGFILGARL